MMMRTPFLLPASLAVILASLAALSGCAAAGKAQREDAEYPVSGGGPASAPAPDEAPRSEVQRDTRSLESVTTAGAATREEAFAAEPLSATTRSLSPSGATIAPAQPQPPPPPAPPRPTAAKPEKEPDPTAEPAKSRDLVIYTARFTMAVYLVDQGLAAVEKIARDNGGYLGQKQDREITVRVPRARFEPSLAAIDRIGDVLHRDIRAEDVTDEHVDLEIRIKNARAMQRRLTDLLTKASVKDALEIEKELHRVTEELERLEGRMKVLKDKIAFSTITVAFTPRGTTIQTARVRLPFPWLSGLNLPSLLSLHEEK